MASTFSDRLRFELQTTGENDSTWGTQLNAAISRIDDSIAGIAAIATTGGSTTLTSNNGTADESRMAMIKVTGVLVSNATLTIPAETKTYVVWNATTGAYTVTIKTSAGTGVVVAQGKKAFIFCDATDCFTAFDDTILSSPVLNESKGTAVASAATTSDIWAVTGSTVHITGVIGMTGLPAAPQAGVWRKLVFDGAVALTTGANFVVAGGTRTTAADDIVFVYADTTTKFYLLPITTGASAANPTGTIAGAAVNGAAATFLRSDGAPAISNQIIIPRIAAGGTVDAITATVVPALTLADQIMVAVVSAGASTSTTPTFAPNGLTARTITARGGAALVVGDIGPAGFVALLEYNLANTRWELLNPAKLGSLTLAQLNTAVSDADVASVAGTETLTNKRVTPRILSAASYTTNTGTSLNIDNLDEFIVTAQAGALLFNNPTGTPTDGQELLIAVTGTAARALTYGTQFEASTVVLPTTTVTTARLDMKFVWRADTSKWRIVWATVAAAASASAMTLLSTVTASASATVDVETTFSSTYDEYIIFVDNLVPSTDGIETYCTLKVGGAYAATNYVFHSNRPTSAANTYVADFAAIASPATQITVLGNSQLSSDASATTHLKIYVSNPASTTKVKTIHWNGVCMNTVNELVRFVGGGANTATTALTGVRLYASIGNLSCTARLYGIANS